MTSVDLAILGGGCAGLSLARDIARLAPQTPGGRRVVVLEPRLRYENDRTWCGWFLADETQDPLVSRRWPAWRFSLGEEQIVHRSDRSHYGLISSEDFYRDALAAIASAAAIDLRLGTTVDAVEPRAGKFTVRTTAGDFLAQKVVDTRPPKMELGVEALLFQCFKGVEIETDHTLGDPNVAGLMDHLRSDGSSLCFDYVLPLGPGRWLVEATRFSPSLENEALLSSDLAASLHWLVPSGEFHRRREENGTIPMGSRPPQPTGSAGWVRAGTVGGAVRSASGYAYRRIQHWSQQCARRFVDAGGVMGHPPDSAIRRGMDLVFLQVVRNNPKLAPEIFLRLARGMRPDSLARFMVDRARGADLIALVQSLPKMPFLKQLFRRHPSPSKSAAKNEVA